jgi:hypothetical protein
MTLVFLTSQVVTSLKVLTQLMVGYVISFGHKVAVIQSYGSALSAYGLIFLGAHFVWAFSLMFLFSGYWQELIESIYGHTTN